MKYKLSKEEVKSIAEVALWAFGSALVAGTIALTQWSDAPAWLLAVGPGLNVFAFGVMTWLKENKPE